jgi:hypothetical protein
MGVGILPTIPSSTQRLRKREKSWGGEERKRKVLKKKDFSRPQKAIFLVDYCAFFFTSVFR